MKRSTAVVLVLASLSAGLAIGGTISGGGGRAQAQTPCAGICYANRHNCELGCPTGDGRCMDGCRATYDSCMQGCR